MSIRRILLAATLAIIPGLALAQAQPTPPDAAPPAAAGAPSAAPEQKHHDRAAWQHRRSERHQKYEQLGAADKAKFDDLSKQIHALRQQQRQLLGVAKS